VGEREVIWTNDAAMAVIVPGKHGR
jgi:hypothetical protein